ncbi:MAG TPA: MerR family transcriptional regulator [Phenylobacterium sp.]|nr:MerR family transcriptional regulator [Phenylobacterium sp.]
MSVFTVSEVAKLSGVSVRALHHYDEIGLLKPGHVGENGYRYYGRDELLRLQQILFHRELGFRLEEIRQVLDAPGFDRVAALRAHRGRLMAEARRYRALVKTLDATLAELEGGSDVDEKAMYRGFDPEKQAEYETWVVGHYGPGAQAAVDAAKAITKDWTQADFDAHQAEIEAIEAQFAEALSSGLPADSERVQGITRRHHAWVGRSWDAPPGRGPYLGLRRLYEDHPDFRTRYEGRAPGLTAYLSEAMRLFAERELA